MIDSGFSDEALAALLVVFKSAAKFQVCGSVERRLKARAWIVERGLNRHKTQVWEEAYNEIP